MRENGGFCYMKINKLLMISASALLLLTSCGGENSSSSLTNISGNSTSSSSPAVSDSGNPGTSSDSKNEELLSKAQTAIDTAVSKANLIKDGTITYSYEMPIYEDDKNVTTIPFEFGRDDNGDVLHYSQDQYGSTYDYYVMKDSKGEFVVVEKDANEELSCPSYIKYEGVGYAFNIFNNEVYFFGTESLVKGVFDIAKENANRDLQITQENDGDFAFTSGYLYKDQDGNNYYYQLEMGFSIGEQGEFKTARVSSSLYPNNAYDIDPEYNTASLKANAVASKVNTYEISQNLGSRTFANPYEPDTHYATSFDLVYNNQTITSNSVFEIEASKLMDIDVTNVLPTTVNWEFDTPEISVISGDEDGVFGYFSTYSKNISLSTSSSGDYTIQVKSKNVTKTFGLKVSALAPKSLYISYSTKGVSEYNSYTYESEMEIYASVEVVYEVSVSPYGADQEYSASVTSSAANDYTFEKKEVALNSWTTGNFYCFTGKTAGDYTLKFVADADSNVYEEVKVSVKAAPTFAEVLTEDYAVKATNPSNPYGDSEVQYYLSFTPSGTGESGSVTIDDHFNSKKEVASYAISKNNNGGYDFTLTHVSGDSLNLTLKMGADYSIMLYEPDDEYGLGKLLSKATLAFMASGSYSGTNNGMSLTISLGANYDFSFNMYNEEDYATRIYFEALYEKVSEDESVYSLQAIASSQTNQTYFTLPMSFTIDKKTLKTLSISFTYDNVNYSFTLVR